MSFPPSDEPIDSLDRDEYEPYEEVEDLAEEGEYADRHYRAVSPLAVLSLVLGGLSFLTIFNWFFTVLPLAGALLGIVAVRRIDRSPQELQGRPFALAGLGLAVVLGTAGSIGLVIRENYLVPAGYKPINFADLQRDKSAAAMIPQSATELDGERVFIKGYMYPGRQVFNLTQFIMVPSSGLCNFCLTKIEPTQMIRVEMVGDRTADFKTSLAGVGGKLTVDQKVVLGSSPYLIEADVFR